MYKSVKIKETKEEIRERAEHNMLVVEDYLANGDINDAAFTYQSIAKDLRRLGQRKKAIAFSTSAAENYEKAATRVLNEKVYDTKMDFPLFPSKAEKLKELAYLHGKAAECFREAGMVDKANDHQKQSDENKKLYESAKRREVLRV